MILRIDTNAKDILVSEVSDDELILKTLTLLFNKEAYKEYEVYLTTKKEMSRLDATKKD